MVSLSQKRLFDEAYDAYLALSNLLEGSLAGLAGSVFDEGPSAGDLACSLDLFLQGALVGIGFADGALDDAERDFIVSLPDAFDEICAKNRGYRRFLRTITKERYEKEGPRYYEGEGSDPLFLEVLDDDGVREALGCLERIFNAFVALDDCVSEEENAAVVAALARLRARLKDGAAPTPAASVPFAVSASHELAHSGPEVGNPELDEAIGELEGLIGLDYVKQEVLSTINLLKINQLRVAKGFPELQVSRHMVFTGNPGTGKTTVARILAKIYKSLGVVSKGQLVETDRSGMVAGYVGQTALKTAQAIRRARGGVLFIDEAYALSPGEGGGNDYGKEAIDTLVKGMEDNRDDLVVIVAGYVDEMQRFIQSNPGLRSRFNKYIAFDDYTASELLDIFVLLCEQARFVLSPDARAVALSYLEGKQGDATFGNARGVRNYFDEVVLRQASRIVAYPDVSDEEIQTITVEDLTP